MLVSESFISPEDLPGTILDAHVHTVRGAADSSLQPDDLLEEARRIGIPKALLTVATTNHPSLRVVEKNGGVFDRETISPRSGETMRRYWIDTAWRR